MGNGVITTNDFVAVLTNTIERFGIEPLTSTQSGLLERHYEMMLKWNRRLNLTRITALEEAARLHYAESLIAGRLIGAARTALDIGSGAGFPAVPLAVLRSDLAITALESNSKKATFLREVKETLELRNLSVANTRVEVSDCASYDLLISRALDRAGDLIPAIASGLQSTQKLIVFCGSDLIKTLKEVLGAAALEELLAIPESRSRFIALFGARSEPSAI